MPIGNPLKQLQNPLGLIQNLFTGESNAVLGLDISSSSVKLVELSRSGDGYRVDAISSEPLPAGAVADKQIADPNAVGEAISRAVARTGSGTRHAAVAVAGSSVITKIINMPSSLSDDELELKFRTLAEPLLGSRGANAVLAKGWKLEKLADIGELLSLLRFGGGTSHRGGRRGRRGKQGKS